MAFSHIFLIGVVMTLIIAEAESSDATIRVGLYNYIPDLNSDDLQSYKEMVEDQFRKYTSNQYTVEAVVNSSIYDPYGDLTAYLTDGGFDMTEIDTVSLGTLVDTTNPINTFIMSTGEINTGGGIEIEDVFLAATAAMTISDTIYGYPTLLCGNFITSIGPASTSECPVNQGRAPYRDHHEALGTCKRNFVSPSWSNYKTVILGKMSDDDGWYLPFIYLDGYIDIHGRDSINTALDQLLVQQTVDRGLCEKLKWFTNLCQNIETNENKCIEDPDSTYIIDRIKHHESLLMFSFSEILAELIKAADYERKSYALTSVSMGPENNLLQFTDGLVVSKSQWENADSSKRDAIAQFIQFFTRTNFRYKLAYGFDLDQPQIRYLLMPNVNFYKKTPAVYDAIYNDALPFLQEAVPAPSLTEQQRGEIQSLLNEEGCLSSMATLKKSKAPGRKTEL